MEQNRSNIFGALLLAQELGYELSGQELLEEIALFPEELQQSKVLKTLKENAESKLKTDVGQPYTDVAQPDADGQEVSLKSVVEAPGNKYVLLDFWASWCGPCMGEVPHLKKTYDEFHKKGFEIYGVSFDKDRGKWLAAVDQNGMNWVHVSEVNGFDNQAAPGLRRAGHSVELPDRQRRQDRRQEPPRRGALRKDRRAAGPIKNNRSHTPPFRFGGKEGCSLTDS